MNLEKLSYWVGLAQADGYFKKQKIVWKGKPYTKYSLVLSQRKDKENIVIQFRDIFNELFQRNNNCISIYKNMRIVNLSITSLLKVFEENDIVFSDPPKPPRWIKSSRHLFGAYLGGVIDGDGDIRISRKEYPYCAVRITSGRKQEELIKNIKEKFCCKVNYRRLFRESYIGNRKIRGNSSV